MNTLARAKVAGDAEAARERLEAHVNRQGLRLTKQRRSILDALVAARDHITVDELVDAVRKTRPRVGHATVYRTLRLLVASKIVIRRQFGDGVSRYELHDEAPSHHHLVCRECGDVIEFRDPALDRATHTLTQTHGFSSLALELAIYGACARCLLASSSESILVPPTENPQ